MRYLKEWQSSQERLGGCKFLMLLILSLSQANPISNQ